MLAMVASRTGSRDGGTVLGQTSARGAVRAVATVMLAVRRLCGPLVSSSLATAAVACTVDSRPALALRRGRLARLLRWRR